MKNRMLKFEVGLIAGFTIATVVLGAAALHNNDIAVRQETLTEATLVGPSGPENVIVPHDDPEARAARGNAVREAWAAGLTATGAAMTGCLAVADMTEWRHREKLYPDQFGNASSRA